MASLVSLPAEVLDRIAFNYACPHPFGLPLSLQPLLLTCRTIKHKLAVSHVYAALFRHCFSAAAVSRRGFPPSTGEYHDQLVHYCTALRMIRARRFYDQDDDEPDIDSLLATVTLMLLDDDGLNSTQLQLANAYEWIVGLIKERLYEDSDTNDGWPLNNIRNSFALWICWMLTTPYHLQNESEQEQDEFIDLIFPFVHVHFRYPTAYAPYNHFNLPLTTPIFSADQLAAASHPTPHGPFPIYLPSYSTLFPYFGPHIELMPPLASTAARLLYFARREVYPVGIPPTLPRNRAEAITRNGEEGLSGPTAEDIDEWNGLGNWVNPSHRGCTVLPPLPSTDEDPNRSVLRDPLFNRMRTCLDVCDDRSADPDWESVPLPLRPGTVYKPGSLTGLWAGRMTVPEESGLRALLFPPDGPRIPQSFSEISLSLMTVPIYMRLEEHAMFWPATPPPVGGVPETYRRAGLTQLTTSQKFLAEFDQGFMNSWFPDGMKWRKEVEYGMAPTTLEPGEDPAGTPVGHEGESVLVTVPGPHGEEEYAFQTLRGVSLDDTDTEPSSSTSDTTTSRGRRAARGRFHNHDSCPGCLLREDIARKDRSDSMDDDEEEIWSSFGLTSCPGVVSIFITGSTDSRHSAAWSPFIYTGRVRPWDGLIAIVRKPNTGRYDIDEILGKIVLYGYLEGGKNFVGGWRMVGGASGVGEAGWEGAFSLGRRE